MASKNYKLHIVNEVHKYFTQNNNSVKLVMEQ